MPFREMENIGRNINLTIEVMKPFPNFMLAWCDMVQFERERIIEKYNSIISKIKRTVHPLMAVQVLRENQYVYWYPLQDDFMDKLLCTDNVDNVLLNFATRNNNSEIDDTVSKCLSSNSFAENDKILFFQAVESFRRGEFHIAIVALFSIIDGLLSKVSQNTNTNMKKRIESILEKLECEEKIAERDEYALLILWMTLDSAIEAFGKFKDFACKELPELNRHCIMHGRSTREFSMLDCIKLMNCIYGIILIDNFKTTMP